MIKITLLDDYKKFEELEITATTLLFADEIADGLMNDFYVIVDDDFIITDEMMEDILSTSSNCSFDWESGINYDYVQDLVIDLCEKWNMNYTIVC